MRGKGWVVCPHCSKTAAACRRGGVHESCAANARAELNSTRDQWAHLEDGWEQGGWASRLRKLLSFLRFSKPWYTPGSLLIGGYSLYIGRSLGGYARKLFFTIVWTHGIT
jgi:hypothetical protein